MDSRRSRRPWIDVVADGGAPPYLQAMYDAMRDPRGHVDHILTIHGLHPASLRAHYDFYRVAMTGSPDLSKVRREMIAVVVSALNRCEYWIRHHAAGLGRLTRDDALARALVADASTAPIAENDRAMLAYAAKLTREPWAIVEDDVAALRRAGFSDRAILDINLVAGYYAFVNRLASGLGVPLEAFWEEESR